MFKHMIVPIDLAHQESLNRALVCAAKMSKDNNIPITYVGVTSSVPSAAAPSPGDFQKKLDAFAAEQGEIHGIDAKAHTSVVIDLATDLEAALIKAIDNLDADLVVMASHVPGWFEHFWHSHGGKLASHARCSVMIVRG